MSKVRFPSLYFLRTYTFWKKLVCKIFKLLLPFLIFVNCKGPYLCPCFGIAFRQLGVIPRTRNEFNEITVVAECYLITNQVKTKESKKLPFRICLPVKLAGRRMSIKNGKKFFVSNLQHCQFKQDGWKTFSMKAS